MLNIQALIQDPSQLSEQTLNELKDLVEKYPFYQTARLLYLINLFQLHHPNFGQELHRSSIFLADRRALFQMVEKHNYDLLVAPHHSATIETESDANHTLSLIDDYLTQSREEQKSKPSLADLTHDYTAFLETLDDLPTKEKETPHQPDSATDELINTFIQQAQGRGRIEMQELDADYKSPVISYEQEEIYTENMVNIYIKQGRYKEAVEILRKICLNNPKKNATFATEIHLLEVILSQKS